MQQTVVDYSFALAVANGLVALLVVILRRQSNDTLVRALSIVVTLAAVLYTAWSAGALDIQHSALVYLAIALAPAGFHVAYKATPGGSSASAATPSSQDGPVASPEAALQAVAAQVVAATGQ